MNSEQTALITGATGFLGRETLRRLLAQTDRTRFVALIRADDDGILRRRHEALVDGLPQQQAERVTPLRGDVTAPRFGVPTRDYAALEASVDRVIHLAATTSFSLPLAIARRRNVDGTLRVLDLCRAIRRRGGLGRLDHVSTAFVAGDRTDVVREHELDRGQRFRNTYEQTKFEAEVHCRSAQNELPIVIHRPSIVIGNPNAREVGSLKGVYGPLRFLIPFYSRWRRVTALVPLPLRALCPLDIVPLDWTADALATLFQRTDAEGRCYHLAAGPEGAVTVEYLASLTCHHFGAPPRRFIVPGRAARRLGRVVKPLLRTTVPALVRCAEDYLPYALGNPLFDTTNVRTAELRPPAFAAYFPLLLGDAHMSGAFGNARLPPATPVSPSARRHEVAATV